MKAKEIHYYLLSLFIRGLGIWTLYLGIGELPQDAYQFLAAPHFPPGFDFPSFYIVAFRFLVAVYFILGAPPFLKLATRDKDNSN